MKLYPQITPIILGLLCSYSITFGQTPAQDKLKREMIRHALEEKMGEPGKENDKYERGSRGTTIYDERVSANPVNVGEREISVCYDPADSNHIVLSYMESDTSGFRFPIFYSNDAGSTWTRSNFDTKVIRNVDFPDRGVEGFGDPAFAWDKNGTVYFAWIYIEYPLGRPPADSIYWTTNWAYSTDNGHTWLLKPNHFIAEGLVHTNNTVYNYKDGMLDREWFAVDNSGGPHQGNLYSSFTLYPKDNTNAFTGVRTKVAGVDTFGPVVKAINSSSNFANVEVDKNGVVHVSAVNYTTFKINHTKSTDAGITFSTPVVVGNAGNVNHYSNHVVHRRESPAVNMATDGMAGSGDHVHIVWSDFPAGTVKSYYAHSDDGGITWSPQLNLNTLMAGNITLMPTVAANGNNVSISFTSVDGNDSANYYQINSTDNGTTFSSPTKISSASCNYHAIGAASATSPLSFGDYNRSVRSLCNVYATWEDCRDGQSSKVYFSKTNYCTEGVREINRINGTAQLLEMCPNPTSDKVTLKIQSIAQEMSIAIMDMTGHEAVRKTFHLQAGTNEETVSVAGLAKGVYVLSLNDGEGVIVTRTLVVR